MSQKTELIYRHWLEVLQLFPLTCNWALSSFFCAIRTGIRLISCISSQIRSSSFMSSDRSGIIATCTSFGVACPCCCVCCDPLTVPEFLRLVPVVWPPWLSRLLVDRSPVSAVRVPRVVAVDTEESKIGIWIIETPGRFVAWKRDKGRVDFVFTNVGWFR